MNHPLRSNERRRLSKVVSPLVQILMFVMIAAGSTLFAQTTQTLTILGANGTVGQVDPYSQASRDGGVTWGPAYLTGWHPWGFAPGTNSWVNFDPSNAVGLNTTTLYRIRFNLPAGYSNPQMKFIIKADNWAYLWVNGTQISNPDTPPAPPGISNPWGPGAWLNQTQVDNVPNINALLQPGQNEIRLALGDYGGIVGLNYRIDITMMAEAPPTLLPPPPPNATPPPFTYNAAPGHFCLPPFMVQDPTKTHYWWVKAAGTGDLAIDFAALSVNVSEIGNITVKVFSAADVLLASHTVTYPTSSPGAEIHAPAITIPTPTAGSLYRIEVSIPVPPPGTQAPRHYRMDFDGATLLGTNSPLQSQSEHESTQWAINVASGEGVDLTVNSGPEAGTSTGTVEILSPSNVSFLTTAIGTPVHLPPSVSGMWKVKVSGLNGHYVLAKTSGLDRGLYLGAFSDIEPPTLIVPGPVTVTTGAGATTCGAVVTDAQLGTPQAKDDCQVSVVRTGVPAGNNFPVGTTTVTYTATDAGGNQVSATQLVKVIDNTAPTITCPQSIFVTIPSGDLSTVINWDAPVAGDNCSATVTCSPASGSSFPPGTTTVTCTATDPAGNRAVCTFTVTVNRAPNCTAAPSIAQLWPPNHQMVDVTLKGVSDPDGDPVRVTITGITQDEPVNTLGDGNTEPDGAIIGTSAAQVRAERSGTPKVPGNGRVYRISYSLSDGRGGVCDGSVAVCVPHDQGNRSVCIDDGQRYNSITGGSVTPSSSRPGSDLEIASDGQAAVIPNSYALFDAYPNPFNPSTTIQYDVSERTHVRLAVFDLLGREVALLVDGERSPGRYTYTFDASLLKSGVYLYRIEMDNFRLTKRFVLLK